MSKKLSQMTLTELWALFPIVLVEHDPRWKQWYEEESYFLNTIFSDVEMLRINHIGSTAIPGIRAKPIIDILLEASSVYINEISEILQNNGYICMSKDAERISLNKGYTENGFAEKVFHVHVRRFGDNDELHFRDYLIANLNIAKEYELLKINLWKRYEHDRDMYTDQKGVFVQKYTAQAMYSYKNRY